MSNTSEKPVPTVDIAETLIVTQKIDDVYTWTLPSRLGDMLHLAEEQFGPRDCSYTILGIHFIEGYPMLWYPKYREDKQNKNIVVTLDKCVITNPVGAYHQLAHETVHLLSPTGDSKSTNFEEGVACYFADYYIKSKLCTTRSWNLIPTNYECALALVKPLLDSDRDCVKRLRCIEPSFSKMKEEMIRKEFPCWCPEIVERLVEPFERK